MENLQIVSLNVGGLQNKNKRNRIFYFKTKKYEIILLQETHSTQEDKTQWKKEWEGPAFFSSLKSLKCGITIHCTNNNKIKATYENLFKATRHLSIKIETDSLSFKVTNIYAPNAPWKRKHFKKLEAYIKNDTKNVLGEDFNKVEDISKDRAGRNLTTQHYGLEHIGNIKNNSNMIDI